MRSAGIGALLITLSLATACTSQPKPVYQHEHSSAPVVETYDGTLEPSEAVLPLVPDAATTLEVTDFDQLRLTLGFGDMTSHSAAGDRARFWRDLPHTATLSDGLLHPVDGQLRSRFGFGADDVAWEASYSGGGTSGWVIAFRESLSMGQVERAVRAKVGPLKGAQVDAANHLVTSTAPPPGAQSWGHDSHLVALVGRPADATYVARGCLSFASVYGPGVEGQLASGPSQSVGNLTPLDGYAIAFGGQLATAELGAGRNDLFDRLRLAGVLPSTSPDFGTAFARGVADPSTGRLGYELQRPTAAVRLTEQGHLPFAICGQR
ncbi:MAG: hypothetical protein FWE71_00245 [Nocardioidaceae bacterium]|nr:hypothetical protein [Nocardioidaceae bacterium]MCL2615078.1 hypothetical protein [Nocardioidaceae bacterium]